MVQTSFNRDGETLKRALLLPGNALGGQDDGPGAGSGVVCWVAALWWRGGSGPGGSESVLKCLLVCVSCECVVVTCVMLFIGFVCVEIECMK